MAKLDSEQSLNNKLVILDDPMSSYDSTRKSATKDVILSLASRVQQLIVLSHDTEFLSKIGKSSSKPCSCLQIGSMENNESRLIEWDVDNSVEEGLITSYKTLHQYVHEHTGDPAKVANSLREWLGDFLGAIERSNGEGRLHSIYKYRNELREINSYSAPFHHQTIDIDTEELRTYARRTLDLLHT